MRAYYAEHLNRECNAEAAEEVLTFADRLERTAYPERFAEIVEVRPAPWLEAAAEKWKSKSTPKFEAEEIQEAPLSIRDMKDMVEMLTDEQIEAAVFTVDPKDKERRDVARFFLQALSIRDERKALDVFRRWANGAV